MKTFVAAVLALASAGAISATAFATPQANTGGGASTPATCPSVQQVVVGTWASGPLTETFGANGDYQLHNANGDTRGRITWSGPDTASITAGSMQNAVYKFMVTDTNELVAINASGIATIYQRQGSGVSVPANCFVAGVRRQIVGTWIAGSYREVYTAQGGYTFNGTEGTYNFVSGGRANLTLGDRSASYRFGMLADGSLVAVSANNRATLYHRE